NIEYPGIPMDEDSYVEFEFEEGVENNKLILQATITEAGIVVEKIDQLGFYRKYFRDLNVYPNPANDYLRISYDKLMSERVMVQLVDLQGNVLKEQEVRKGYDQSFDFDVTKFKRGIYILNFIDRDLEGKSISTFKVFISH
ncbi:MAG: T9SS type A sorting domain-containing protein, partial [Marinoscillum sp.]